MKQIVGNSDLELTIEKGKSSLGFVVIYFFQEGIPVDATLSPLFELISRRCPFSLFYKVDIDRIEESLLEKYKISSIPTILISNDGRILHKIQASTSKYKKKKFKV